MTTRFLLCAVAALLVASPSVGDGPSEEGRNRCRLDSSWFIYEIPLAPGVEMGPFTLTVTMSSPHEGTVSMAWGGFDPTVFGACPSSVELTLGQGVIRRTGIRSFEGTIITITSDVFGDAECVAKGSVWIELDQSCASGTWTGVLELYSAGQDPFSDDEPFVCFPAAEADIKKMTVDGPAASCL